MEHTLSIYVSASVEMDVECEHVGQVLAELPRSIKWVIKRTPGPHEYANPDVDALRASDFYLILMGSDITAPIGIELEEAQRSRAVLFAYRRIGGMLTPAAAFFVHNSGITWHRYETLQDFVRSFEAELIKKLIDGTPGYGLNLSDLRDLSAHLEALGHDDDPSKVDDRRGAGRGGVILPGG